MLGEPLAQLFENNRFCLCELSCVPAGADHQGRVHLLSNSVGEVGGGSVVHGYNHHTAQDAAIKYSYPLCGVLPPEEDAVAFADLAAIKFERKSSCGFRDPPVGPALGAIAAPLDIGTRIVVPPKISEEVCHRSPLHAHQCSPREESGNGLFAANGFRFVRSGTPVVAG